MDVMHVKERKMINTFICDFISFIIQFRNGPLYAINEELKNTCMSHLENQHNFLLRSGNHKVVCLYLAKNIYIFFIYYSTIHIGKQFIYMLLVKKDYL